MPESLSFFLSFLKIGIFTFGGGYAMIPLVQREVIDKGWVKEDEFLELLTLAQSAPGPIALNTAVFVGYKVHGYRGMLAAVMGIILPAFLIILVIAIFFNSIRENRVVEAVFKGIRPAVVALMLAPVFGFSKGLGWTRGILAVLAAFVVWYFAVSPVYMIIVGATGGIAFGWLKLRRSLRNVKDSPAQKRITDRDDTAGGISDVSGDANERRQISHKTELIMVYLQLLYSYLKIGFFGFGGGYAMLALIQNEIVVRHHWLTNSELTDIIAISQMTPGPIAINSATYVGYTVTGNIWGSLLATFAVSLPSLTIMLLITKFYMVLHNNRYVRDAMYGMLPMVVAMILAATLLLLTPDTFIDVYSWLILAAAFFASVKKMNPILVICLSGVVGYLLYGL